MKKMSREEEKGLCRAWSWKQCGHRLRVTRISLGISEQEAAKAYRVSLGTYRKYEAGLPQQSIIKTILFCKTYEVSSDWLLAGEGFNLGNHLTRAKGKVVIAPISSAFRQRQMNASRDG